MFEQIKKYITELEATNSNITIELDSHLMDDLGLDSLDLVELVMLIEDELNIEITDEEIGDLRTVKDIVSYLENKTKIYGT